MKHQSVDIAIAGGGLTGLTAALILEKNAADYTLYEGKAWLGGRTYSKAHEGAILNIGGEWIDSTHTSILALAKELGVELQQERFNEPIRLVVGGAELSPQQLIAMLESILSKLDRTILILDNSPAEWFLDGGTHYRSLDEILPLDLTKNEKIFIESHIENFEGLEVKALQAPVIKFLREDLSHILALSKRSSAAYEYRVAGGMSAMIAAIEIRLPSTKIRVSHKLISLAKDSNGKFHLLFDDGLDGLEVTANTVIMTIPFSVLREPDLNLDESLGLSELNKEAIAHQAYGTNSKIHIPVSSSHQLHYLVDAETKVMAWKFVSGKGVTLYMGGRQGAELSDTSARPLTDSMLEKLGDATVANDSSINNWFKDPFARGSFSAAGADAPWKLSLPSQRTGCEGVLESCEPIDGLIFAGEHTRSDLNGFMESAVRSGEFAARNI